MAQSDPIAAAATLMALADSFPADSLVVGLRRVADDLRHGDLIEAQRIADVLHGSFDSPTP